MRWSIHATQVNPSNLRAVLEAERDHYLATSPIPSPELDQLNSALRASYNGPVEITMALKAARESHLVNHPHPDTPAMVAQMNSAIAGACALATEHAGVVNVSLYGHLKEKIGEESVNIAAEYGNRVTIGVDFVKVRRFVNDVEP